jgi:hypothetical protein
VNVTAFVQSLTPSQRNELRVLLTNPDVVVVSVLRHELKKPAPAKPPRLR